jgi:hypothetical protein
MSNQLKTIFLISTVLIIFGFCFYFTHHAFAENLSGGNPPTCFAPTLPADSASASEHEQIAENEEDQETGHVPRTSVAVAVAADEPASKGMTVGVTIPGATTSGQAYTVPGYVRGIYAFSMKVAVALSILMIIYAGYKYLTSKGESGAINEAKDILFSTLMGAALLMLVVLVANFAGVNVNFINTTP